MQEMRTKLQLQKIRSRRSDNFHWKILKWNALQDKSWMDGLIITSSAQITQNLTFNIEMSWQYTMVSYSRETELWFRRRWGLRYWSSCTWGTSVCKVRFEEHGTRYSGQESVTMRWRLGHGSGSVLIYFRVTGNLTHFRGPNGMSTPGK